MISVIVPVYNCADFLYECLTSLERQTRPPEHLIVVNDGSTDNSPLVIENFAKSSALNITVHSLDRNFGVAHAKNVGLSYVTTPYFTFLGADDFCSPRLLEVYERFFSLDSSLGIVGVGCSVVDVHGVEVGRLKGYPDGFNATTALYYQIKRNHLWSGTSCFRRLERMSGFDTELYNAVDFDFCFQYLLKGLGVRVTSEPLVYYRSHDKNISKDYRKAKSSIRLATSKVSEVILSELLSTSFCESQVRLCIAFLRFHRERYSEAYECLQKINPLGLSESEKYERDFLLASSAYLINDFAASYSSLARLYSYYPNDPAILNNLSVLGVVSGRLTLEEAETLLRNAIELLPSYIDASNNMHVFRFSFSIDALKFTKLPLRDTHVHG